MRMQLCMYPWIGKLLLKILLLFLFNILIINANTQSILNYQYNNQKHWKCVHSKELWVGCIYSASSCYNQLGESSEQVPLYVFSIWKEKSELCPFLVQQHVSEISFLINCALCYKLAQNIYDRTINHSTFIDYRIHVQSFIDHVLEIGEITIQLFKRFCEYRIQQHTAVSCQKIKHIEKNRQ